VAPQVADAVRPVDLIEDIRHASHLKRDPSADLAQLPVAFHQAIIDEDQVRRIELGRLEQVRFADVQYDARTALGRFL
jgi:hypothetical protein